MLKAVPLTCIDRVVRRYLPDAFLFAVALTLIVYLLGFSLTDHSPVDLVQYFGEGFWGLLEFAMQMTLIVVTGYILASPPVIDRLLRRIAGVARTSGRRSCRRPRCPCWPAWSTTDSDWWSLRCWS